MCAASRQSPFTDIITLTEVQSLADLKTFARGKAYFHDGVVSRLEEHDGVLRASVRGTHRYSVELGVGDDGELTYECDCPVGGDGIFCKHAVATALSWLENSGEEVFQVDETEAAKPRKKRKTYEEQIREYVAALDKESLQGLLLEAVERDMTLRDKLLFAARAASASELPSMKTAVRQATRISRPLDWRESGAYGDGLMSLADMLRQRLAGPKAEQVVELAELAIAGAEKSLEQIDDSGGDVMPAIMELASVHLAACQQTRPDAVKLAERLFRLQTEGVWDTFYDVLPAYAEPLGDTGLRMYRELVGNGWDALPSLAPSNEYRRSFDPLRMRLERAMERLAELDGDVDALIRIRSKDLSSPYRFLLVAELCAKHGRPDEGLTWAERGLRESGKNTDVRLLDFCITEYLRRKDFEKADVFAWQRFESRPVAEAFTALMDVAKTTGRYDLTRERALKHIWGLVRSEEATSKAKRSHWQTPSRTELVKVFLAERESETAWEAFCGGPVAVNMWATMAAVRAKTHPHDAIALYHRLLPIAAENGTRNARYDEAAGIVRAIGRLRAELGEHAEFTIELDEIRNTYRAKRNFIKMLAAFQ
ncbi:SWIM zinc finger family protein [Paraburkholderia sp. RL17-380-BIE-A]|uniref:SWIM zinc finger family protein n=1 Tax=Paraburkholderia sp. RL17-380-BIE-A TaxID=3031630 RepID=UPI0038B9C888